MENKTDWESFFTQGTPVIALPHWHSPHSYIPAYTPWQRWQGSYLNLYLPKENNFFDYLPSWVRRYILRIKAALGLLPMRIANSSDNLPLQQFVREAIPQMSWAVVIVGVANPEQKLIIQIWDRQGNVLGYLKYSENPLACQQITREYQVLCHVSYGPKILKYGTLGNGTALLLSQVPGKNLPGKLPPVKEVLHYLESLTVSAPMPLDKHPWIQSLQGETEEKIEQWLDGLSDRYWPIVVHHGDFHSKNILQSKDKKICAIDWEYGILEGFPYLDLAYYLLMLGKWRYKWSPQQAMDYAMSVLCDRAWTGLSQKEAKAIIQLTAYKSYQQFLKNGHRPDFSDQSWRKELWQL